MAKLKTVELQKTDGSYDGGVTLTRDASDNLVFTDGALTNMPLSGLIKQSDIGCKVRQTTTATTVTATEYGFTFDDEVYDTDAMHDTVTNNERVTIVTPGKYLVIGNIAWTGSPNEGRRMVLLRLNGTTATNGSIIAATNAARDATNTFFQMVATEVNLVAGDWVRMSAYQGSGGNLDIFLAENFSPMLSVRLIGEA